jgi:hypothetical protein
VGELSPDRDALELCRVALSAALGDPLTTMVPGGGSARFIVAGLAGFADG